MIKVIWPSNISLEDWSACLVSDFSNENLPVLQDGDDWREWGSLVAGTGIFQKANVPSPYTFDEKEQKELYADWDEWAQTVYTIMSDNYNTTQ
jgi:hypothetical protein